MTNYTKTTDFAAKDSLPSGDSGKIIRGTEFETEFDNIATAVNSKSDANNPTFTGTVTIDGLTVNGNTVLGNAATDTVTVTADIASNLIPSADDTYNLGAVGAEWNDLHVDGVAYIDTIAGFATTENITFGDNDKAIFGAGSDLQIFHTGSHSYVTDNGTGDLKLYGANVEIGNTSGFKNFLGQSGGASIVYYNNAAKLATTSTGIDVTGTVTADGLDASTGDITTMSIGFNGSRTTTPDGLSYPIIWRSASAHPDFSSGDLVIQARSDADRDIHFVTGNTPTERMKIASNGDVSLFEDTGTTPKFVWDSSAERLGIGTSSPRSTINASSATGAVLTLESSDATLGENDVVGQIDFYANDASTNSTGNKAFIKAYSETAGGNKVGLDFATSSSDSATGIVAMTIDSSRNVGIGTDSPNSTLEVSGNSAGGEVEGLRLTNSSTTTNSSSSIIFNLSSASADSAKIEAIRTNSPTSSDTELAFSQLRNGTLEERIRIDSVGNVGIGTSNPQGPLHVQLSSARNLVVDFDTEGDSRTSLRSIEDTTNRLRPIQIEGQEIVLGTAAFDQTVSSEAMRIDSSQNLLVGKTSADSLNTVGAEVQADGQVKLASDGKYPLQLNRLTSDGEIINLRKDGSTVGTVGSNVGRFYIHGSYGAGSGLRFDNASIRPATSTGTSSDDTTDLGAAAARFKDLHLSGGAYLGGVAAANKLDDYEEGTWTPVASNAYGFTLGTPTGANGSYTKVGRSVSLKCGFTSLDSADVIAAGDRFEVTGIPFSTSGNYTAATASAGSCFIYNSFGGGALATGTVTHSGSVLIVMIDSVLGSPTFSNDLNIGIVYEAA